MDNCTQNIAIGFLFIIIIYLVINQKNMSKNKENFALSSDDLTLVRTEINRIYDMDVEAIRNLGAISKSLLTGTNTFTPSTSGTPGDLNIPADNTILQGGLSLLNTTFEATKQDRATSHIVSDIGNYKTLMITGNDSGGDRRRIGMWDDVTIHGDLNIDANQKIYSPGRLAIDGEEKLILYNKAGAIISKGTGGNGRLDVEGDITVGGTANVSGMLGVSGRANVSGMLTVGGIAASAGTIFTNTSWNSIFNGTDAASSVGYILSDNVTNKSLMIVGNDSGGGERRRISMWDDVTIHGDLYIDPGRSIYSPGRLHLNGTDSLFIMNQKGVTISKSAGGTGDLGMDGNLYLGGSAYITGGLTVNANHPIYSPGRLAIAGEEKLILYNKEGTIISKGTGGNGNLDVDGSLNVTGSFNLLPRGCVIAFSGYTAPPGWQICDGKDGLPDLRYKFILGGNGQNTWYTGGEETVTLTEAQMPRHSHGKGQAGSAAGPGIWTDLGGWHNGRDAGQWYTDATGGSQPHNNMPPYYVLLYIFKL